MVGLSVARWLGAISFACVFAIEASTAQTPTTTTSATPTTTSTPPNTSSPGRVIDEPSGPWQCDGYSIMSAKGDGMITPSTGGFWVAPSERMRRAPPFVAGVGYCTSAIERLDAQFPHYWQRKVSFLQSRAIHRLLADDAAGALLDVDAADAAMSLAADAYFRRSIGANTNFIRAMALVKKGDRARGEAIAMETWSQRPYSREVIGAALVAIGPQGSRASIDTLLKAAGKVDPSQTARVFVSNFETGRFADALAVYDELSPPQKVHDQTYDMRTNLLREEMDRTDAELFWLELGGRKAYALAATGKVAEARAALAEAEVRRKAATPPPEPLPAKPSNRERTKSVVREQANLDFENSAPAISAAWTGLVDARIAAGEGKRDQARAIVDSLLQRKVAEAASYAAIDVRLITDPPGVKDAPIINEIKATFAQIGLPKQDAKTLFSYLLDAEWIEHTKGNVGWMDAMFMSKDKVSRGNCKEETKGELRVICFWGRESSTAVTEEIALWRAAEAASASGASYFLIEKRNDIRHSIVTTMYGSAIGPATPNGLESRLTVRFLNSNADCWRCISTADVMERIGTLYRPPAKP